MRFIYKLQVFSFAVRIYYLITTDVILDLLLSKSLMICSVAYKLDEENILSGNYPGVPRIFLQSKKVL